MGIRNLVTEQRARESHGLSIAMAAARRVRERNEAERAAVVEAAALLPALSCVNCGDTGGLDVGAHRCRSCGSARK